MRPIKKYIALYLIFFSITYAQNVSIKIDFTSNFYSQFQLGGVWYKQQNPFNVDSIKIYIIGFVQSKFNQFGISVSQTTGSLTAYVTAGGSGEHGTSDPPVGAFVNGTASCSTYCNAFYDTTQYNSAIRIARALSGTICHELGHLLNSYHYYAFSFFSPSNPLHVDNYYFPKEIIHNEPSEPPGNDSYYGSIMASTYLKDSHRAINDRVFDNHSINAINFANSGGCYVNADMVWGIRGKTFSLLNNVTIADDAKFYIAGDGYTHNLNGKIFSGGTIYQAGSVGGLAAKVKNGSTVKGLFPTIQSAINAAASGNTVEISSGSFNETLSFNNKQWLTVVGQGIYSTLLNNQISLTSSSNISLSNFRAFGGIQIYGGSGNSIQNCNIENNGIYLYNSSPTITGNTIQYCGDGVYADYYSSPAMTNNLLQNNSYAIRCNSGSSPNLSSQYQNSNVIRSNSNDGVYAIYGSNPNLGSGSNGRNSIYSNGTPAVSAVYSSYITAANNWWGTATPPPSMFYTFYGSIDHSGELTSNPNYSIKTFDENSTAGIQANLSYKAISDEINEALDKQKDKKYDEAISSFLVVFKNNKDALLGKYALSKIEECFTQAGKKDYLDYSKKIIKPLINEGSEVYVLALELETHQMVNAGMYKEAVNNLQTILNKYNLNMYIEKNTLFRLGAFYSQFFGDKVTAAKYFEELKRKYPQDDLVNHIEIVKSFGVVANSSLQDSEMILFSEEQKVETEKEITKYVVANYPNPFNPTTTISYSMPKAGHVVLKVFDVLGREVVELANGFKEKGKHIVTFNARSLASGFYVYTIKVNDFFASKKMLLTK